MQRVHDFYLGDIRLPITPDSISTKIRNKNEVINLLNGEEYNLIKRPGLTEFEFKFRLPDVEYPTVDGFIAPGEILSILERYKTQKDKGVFEFIIIRYGEGLVNSINKAVTLEDYSIDEDAKNVGDLIVNVKLKQFLELKTKKLSVKSEDDVNINKPLRAAVETFKIIPKTSATKAIVLSGMTLSMIAKKYFGDSSKWRELARINGIKNPNRIKVGQVIKFV